jgi:hypothetical protein
LKLVHQDVVEALLVEATGFELVCQEVTEQEQQVDLVEHSVRALDLLVARDHERPQAHQTLGQVVFQGAQQVVGEWDVALFLRVALAAYALCEPLPGVPADRVGGEVHALLETRVLQVVAQLQGFT